MSKNKKEKIGKGIKAPVQPSEELAVVVGSKPISKGQIIKKLWEYIKKHKLNDGHAITMDATLMNIFSKKFATSGTLMTKEYQAEIRQLEIDIKANEDAKKRPNKSKKNRLKSLMKKLSMADYEKLLKKVTVKKVITMFEMNKLLADHTTKL